MDEAIPHNGCNSCMLRLVDEHRLLANGVIQQHGGVPQLLTGLHLSFGQKVIRRVQAVQGTAGGFDGGLVQLNIVFSGPITLNAFGQGVPKRVTVGSSQHKILVFCGIEPPQHPGLFEKSKARVVILLKWGA